MNLWRAGKVAIIIDEPNEDVVILVSDGVSPLLNIRHAERCASLLYALWYVTRAELGSEAGCDDELLRDLTYTLL
jgi:hypothetical protein